MSSIGNETLREIIKSFAHGATSEEVSTVYTIPVSEASEIQKSNADEIKRVVSYYKEMEG